MMSCKTPSTRTTVSSVVGYCAVSSPSSNLHITRIARHTTPGNEGTSHNSCESGFFAPLAIAVVDVAPATPRVKHSMAAEIA